MSDKLDDGLCRCRQCGATGYKLDEFTSPHTGLCAKCNAELPPAVDKPPLGLMPRPQWLRQRHDEIVRAMARYTEAGKTAPTVWVLELHGLLCDKEFKA